MRNLHTLRHIIETTIRRFFHNRKFFRIRVKHNEQQHSKMFFCLIFNDLKNNIDNFFDIMFKTTISSSQFRFFDRSYIFISLFRKSQIRDSIYVFKFARTIDNDVVH